MDIEMCRLPRRVGASQPRCDAETVVLDVYVCESICACVQHHSRTYPASVTRSIFGSSFIALSSLPLCLYFAFLQTDSENRSLVTQRIGDGRSGRGENRPAVLIAATHAVIRPTYAV